MRARRRGIGIAILATSALALATAGCEDEDYFAGPGVGAAPDAPRGVAVSYWAGAVTVSWELGAAWDGESFLVYSKRSTDADYFLVAEVTSCADGFCTYTDTNIAEGRTYDYYVAAIGPDGQETPSARAVRIDVPSFTPPPAPDGMAVVALDRANFLVWEANARSADDFSYYRVYLFDGTESFLLGETDSEGFLDLLALNGSTYSYFVTAVDQWGHESQGGPAAEGTPRPDFHGEVLFDHFLRPDASGFAFQEDESTIPVVGGADPSRHLRLEVDPQGWWLVPAVGVSIHGTGFVTSALKCGPGSDAGCVALEQAPAGGYVTQDVWMEPGVSYPVRVAVPGGGSRHGVIRVELLGEDQEGSPLMIFDWAYQLQVGNPNLSPRAPGELRIR
jgi:hypothetical protein